MTKKNEVAAFEEINPEVVEEHKETAAVLSTQDRLIEGVNAGHRAAKKGAEDAIIWSIWVGYKMLQLKRTCAHGDWMGIVKKLDFAHRTSTRYVQIARQAVARLPELGNALQEDCNLEALRPFVSTVASGGTIGQLCLDWGIVKAPRPIGGNPDLLAWFAERPEMAEKYPQATKPDELDTKDRRTFQRWLKKRIEEAKKEAGEITPEDAAVLLARQRWAVAFESMEPVISGGFADLPAAELVELETTLNAWHLTVKKALTSQGKGE